MPAGGGGSILFECPPLTTAFRANARCRDAPHSILLSAAASEGDTIYSLFHFSVDRSVIVEYDASGFTCAVSGTPPLTKQYPYSRGTDRRYNAPAVFWYSRHLSASSTTSPLTPCSRRIDTPSSLITGAQLADSQLLQRTSHETVLESETIAMDDAAADRKLHPGPLRKQTSRKPRRLPAGPYKSGPAPIAATGETAFA